MIKLFTSGFMLLVCHPASRDPLGNFSQPEFFYRQSFLIKYLFPFLANPFCLGFEHMGA